MEFTYVLKSVQYTILLQMIRALDDVYNSSARVVSGDRLAGVNFSDGRQ
jgi:hypothetical protein